MPAWLSADLGAGRPGLGSFWSWWREGLLGCLPGWLRRWLDPAAKLLLLELDGEHGKLSHLQGRQLCQVELSNVAQAGLLKGAVKGRARPVVVKIPRAWVLLRKIRFPLATRDNIRQVVGFEIDRLTPFQARDVVYDFRLLEAPAEEGELLVELAIVPRSQLEPWLSLVADAGLQLHSLESDALWQGGNLLPPEQRLRPSPVQRVVDLLLLLLLLLLLTAALGKPLWQKRQQVIELDARVSQVRKQADQVLTLQNKLEEAEQSLGFILNRRKQTPTAVQALKRVTELLPDDTWLQRMDIKKGNVELRGMSSQATTLIQLLEESAAFEGVVFRSPVVQAQGAERFHLSSRLLVSGAGE